MEATDKRTRSRWLLLVFSLGKKGASLRVAVWRTLQRFGALSLGNSGYLLANSGENREKLEWLASTIRSKQGDASVLEVETIDNRPHASLKQQFVAARQGEYRVLMGEIRSARLAAKHAMPARQARLNQRFQEIVSRDFFGAPLRKQAEAELRRLRQPRFFSERAGSSVVSPRAYRNREWVTRPRPGVDRVCSAWLIRKFIDPRARFAFASRDRGPAEAVPFDMYEGGGFGHSGEECTFEALTRAFRIRDKRVAVLAEIVHDADLFDDKFGRREGFGIDAVMKGWARQGLRDEELLRRGMELAEGVYRYLG